MLPKLNRLFSALMYFRQLAIRQGMRGNANLREARWRGVDANNYAGPPKENDQKVVKVYAECIDAKWAKRSPENTRVLQKAPPSPENWSIWSLEIKDEHIYQDDAGAFADDEGGDDDDEE